MEDICAVVLCAGDGTRMKSAKPKVLCQVLFKPMLHWITDALHDFGTDALCLVCSDRDELVQQAVPGAEAVIQRQRLGTGHAAAQAAGFLERHRGGVCAVLCGDAPFITPQILRDSLELHRSEGCAVTVISARLENPCGYGRIVRNAQGHVTAIVEQRDADEAQAAIREVNSGAYWFDVDFLLEALRSLTPANSQGEYYLTDCVAYAVEHGRRAAACLCEDSRVVLGANDRAGLLALNEAARAMILNRHLENGVEIVCTDGVIIGPDVAIGPDTQILPGAILRGKTQVGRGCTLGPNTIVENCTIGDGTTVNASQLFDSQVGAGVRVGPYSYVRPGCTICDNAKIGDFVELKNSVIGEKTSIAHLSYIGDADLGRQINMGGGIIVCNYDGKHKYRTKVEDNAFIGCNTNLVAPVTVEEGAYVAAGSTITELVPKHAFSIARARQVNKASWKDRRG